ncbi:AAA family ATPase [Actinomadura hibisca]|uniref:AAA family ATPase n=1 Tax=Actinomadura hibisca TaxID=68565 RepID=UPI00083379FF|nr:AAA family ATPase [Actinomadura hibisca]
MNDEGFDRPPPHDIGAEQATLGAAIQSPEAAARVAEIVARDDFYRPSHQTIYDRITTMRTDGDPVDIESLRLELLQAGAFTGDFTPLYLFDLVHACPTTANAGYYARKVAALAGRRRVIEAMTRGLQKAHTPDADLTDVLAETRTALEIEAGLTEVGADVTAVELDDLLDADDQDDVYDWLIPGFLERGDRFVLTGEEGAGKSTLLRQMGIQAASGIHPLTGEPIKPLRVLHVDLENSERQSRRELRPLRLAAGQRYQRGHFHLRARPEGMDLTTPADREWLARLAETIAPDILIIGPLYKAANGDPLEETSAKPVAVTLDALRVRIGCALLIEAHAAKTTTNGKRAKEPYGWSGWLRWPEFGYHIGKDGQLTAWRGNRDATRPIPGALQRGGSWPWSPITRPRDALWAHIVSLCTEAGDRLTIRDLAKLTGSSYGSVNRAVEEHRHEWDAMGTAA